VFSVGRLVSRRCHIIDSIAQVSSDLRYYEGSDSCRVIPQSRSPRLLRLTFLTFHPQPRDAPVHRFTRHFSVYGEFQASPYPSRLAANIPPNQVRHPTDRQFASGCFPPRLTATQLPSATEPWHAPTRTSTVLIRRPHGRTRAASPERRLSALTCCQANRKRMKSAPETGSSRGTGDPRDPPSIERLQCSDVESARRVSSGPTPTSNGTSRNTYQALEEGQSRGK
jgi:hypothetical protein